MDTTNVDRKRVMQRGTHVDFLYPRCEHLLSDGEQCGDMAGHEPRRGHRHPEMVWSWWLARSGDVTVADLRAGKYGPVPVTFSWESEELCADWNREGTDVCVRPAGHAGRHVYSLASSTMAREVTADKYASRLAKAALLRAADAVEAQECRVTRTVTVLPRTIRKAVLLRDGGVCATCGLEDDDLSFFDVDHIIPRSHGGTDTPDNGQVLCPNCHRRKTLADSAAR